MFTCKTTVVFYCLLQLLHLSAAGAGFFFVADNCIQSSVKVSAMKQGMPVKKKMVNAVLNGTTHRISEMVYDVTGNETKQVSYAADNTIVSLTTSTYDNKGRLLTRITDDKTGAGKQQWKYEYTFAEAGRIAVSTIVKSGSKTIITETFLYEKDGAYSITTKEDNETIEIASYNKAGLKLQWMSLKNNVNVQSVYDVHGNITEQKETRPGKPLRLITYSNGYDSNGRLVSIATGNTVTHYHYNNHDKIKEEIRTQDNGAPVSVVTYDYEYW